MEGHLLLDWLVWVKLYAVELSATAVFVVFVLVEAVRAIRRMLTTMGER
jgi:hypothetical protein